MNYQSKMTTPNKFAKCRIMTFDVETTGLIPKYFEKNGVDQNPHILQLSYVIFDTDTRSIVKSVDHYIRIPETIEILPVITQLTGITREICETRGISIETALSEFCKDYHTCDYIVAHNHQFDKKMIEIELARLQISSTIDIKMQWDLSKSYCTMQEGIDICKIERNTSAGKLYYKFPKLSELYETLFVMEKVPPNLHNSLVDTYVCLRCFLQMKMGIGHSFAIPSSGL